MTAEPGDGGRQRVDRWLWHARVVRTRTDAAALAASGQVRLNGDRIASASKPVRAGDVLTIGIGARVRVLRVIGFAERRGDAALAMTLFDDLTGPPPAVPRENAASAGPINGRRPTKRDRRALDRLRAGDA